MLGTISLITSVTLNLLLGLFVLLKNPRSTTSRMFFGLTASFAAFSTINAISVNPVGLDQLTWIRIDLFAGAYMLLFAYLTVAVFPGLQFAKSRLRRAAILYTVLVSGLVLTPFVFSGIEYVNGSPQPIPAPGIVLYAIQQMGLLLAALLTLVRKFRRSAGIRRQQYKYILAGVVLAIGSILFFNFILVQTFQITSLVFLGSFGPLFFTASLAYAIIRHRLLDIRLLVARSVAYMLLLGTMAALYGSLLFGITTYFFRDTTASLAQNLIYVGLAIVLAFTFQPLRRIIERLTDRLFYRDRYDGQEVLNQVGKILASELMLEKLLDHSLQQICNSLRVEMGQFMVFNKGMIYKVAHFGPLPDKMLTVPTAGKLRKSIIVADELEGGERKQIMDDHGIRVSLMLRTRDEFVGYLLLGAKLSGNIYNDQDLKVLEILAGEISIAISNAKAYEDIAEFNVTLQQKVDQATAKLRQVNAHLQEMDKSKDDFISMAAHQLRTPLTTIKGYLSMMLEGDTGKLNPEQKEFAGYALDGAERMVNLVSDLLNVSRMSSGKFVIDRQPADMAALITDEVRQLDNHARAKGLKLIFEQPKTKVPLVEFDADKTRQVVMNFIDNAIYYTKTGSVRVTLEIDKQYVRVKVSDTGIGVPKEAQSKLFTKFYRAENAQQVRPDGTGLGLYLAKRVIEDQGGTIIFESVPNRGSMFGFELPINPPGVKHEPRKQPE